MRESKIEEILKRRVQQEGGRCLKWVSPGCAGVPDRILFFPGGVIAFVELKATGETERPLQKHRQEQLRALGALVFPTVDSREKIDFIITACLGRQKK